MTRTKNKGKGKGRSRKPQDDRSDLIEKIDMQNERFYAYYKAQKIVPDEEWDLFMDALRQHLPTTFRVAGSRQTANTLNATIKDVHVPSLSNVIFEGQQIPPPVQIPWYPDGLAWHFNVPKKVLRRSPEFKKFHSFLVFETEVGNISRQEGVSMLPPLFLDVEPHHRVMDMCAAPGSKTAQILEALHARDTITSTSIPSGLLLANDSDNKRTHLLIHQSARLPSPALMVTNLDASNYPSIKIPTQNNNGTTHLGPLLFDRILCDVPCSGDGTIRKNMGIWKSWQTMDGNGLHGLQVRILLRAMKMLKDDGRIVYSTCSLNPVENEAVIAEALKNNPAFELVDVSSQLPQLRRRPGLTIWRATADRSAATTFESYEELMNSSLDDSLKAKMTEGHWPPKDVDTLNLSRCMRIYPHLQDSGGFFVAVLEKVKKLTDESGGSSSERKREANDLIELPEPKKQRMTSEAPYLADDDLMTDGLVEAVPNEVDSMDTEKGSRKLRSKKESLGKGGGSFKENPYTFLAANDPILLTCIDRLHITSNFPSSNVLVRNPEGDAARSLYLVNDIVKAVIQNNDYNRIRLTAAGTKVFSKQEAGKGTDAQFRVLGEGLPVVLPYIDPASVVIGDMATLKTLVESYYPLCSAFEEPFRGVAEARSPGSHIIRFPFGELEGALLSHDLVLPIWKSNVSLTLMIDKKAKSALSLRLFGADITTAGKDVEAMQLQREAR
ncbi:S-adenosyl-L-methionine-dependent methyltransferase [Crassisporium funariophilum]|nr:S-adenosyl-L-methionine-dependent methyltransferase [Crassisporium funariophilum]